VVAIENILLAAVSVFALVLTANAPARRRM